ncbi:MAG: proC [Chlamydiales bacterium]|jgi:pyrroline-5-carboxylate reductase|nr:proC [Chlamydiales bacterium]
MEEQRPPKLGIIGCGNLGRQLAKRLAPHYPLFLYDREAEVTSEVALSVNAGPCQDPIEVAHLSDILFLVVKPKDFAPLAASIQQELQNKRLIVSTLAGISLETLKSYFSAPVLRMMPNMAIAYGSAPIGLSRAEEFPPLLEETLSSIISLCGTPYWVDESLMDALTALIGSGPAFALVMIESIVESAIAMGLNAPTGLQLTCHMLKNAIQLIEKTKSHPAELKWQIASPSGTTIAGLKALEEKGLRSAIMHSFLAAHEKARQIS